MSDELMKIHSKILNINLVGAQEFVQKMMTNFCSAGGLGMTNWPKVEIEVSNWVR